MLTIDFKQPRFVYEEVYTEMVEVIMTTHNLVFYLLCIKLANSRFNNNMQ